MKRLLIFLLYLLVFTFNSPAQNTGGYHVRHFTTDNGMPSNGIKGMQWDEQTGFLWIATEAGISRFNGLDFTNFTKENTPGLTHERMAYMVKNDRGIIYTSDVGNSFLRVNSGSLVSLRLPELDSVNGFKKRFFFFVSDTVLRKKIYAFQKKTGEMPWAGMLRLSDSTIMISLGNKIIYLLSDKNTDPVLLTLPFRPVNSFMLNGQLFFLNEDRQLLLAKNNLQTFEPVKIVSRSGEPVSLHSSNFLLHWDNGIANPILFSDNNAWLLYYENGVIEARLICSEIPSYSFIRFAQYSEKNKILFIGTDSKGIITINRNRVTPVKKSLTDIGERNAYYSQVELSDGAVLTNEAHIIGGTGKRPAKLPITGKFDYSVYTFGDSLMWYVQWSNSAGKNILHSYNYNSGVTTPFNKISVHANFGMTSLANKFYFASYLGLGFLEGDSIHWLFRPTSPTNSYAAPYTMLPFGPNTLGVVSCDGVMLYDIKNLTVDTLIKERGYCFRSLWKYKDYIFIGSYGKGYYVWKNGKLKSMPLDKSNFLLYTHCFIPDELGFCWMSTNRGLFKAQLSDLIDAYENDRTQVYYHYYGKNDGMDIAEMNGGCSPCALQMKNGVLSFPTMDGLLWVNPSTAIPLLPEGNIYLDEFFAGNRRINPDSLAIKSLPSAARDIMLRLGFSSWCNKENIYLEYRLNKNTNWTPVDIQSGAIISLNNLLPGTYKLQIRKLNGFGVNNYSYKEITFTIKTPWHQQWWFFVLSSLAVLGLLSLYFRYRTRQYEIRQRKLEKQVAEKTRELQQQNEILEKNNTIKTRLISIISHDIVTPLKFLTVAGKNLLEKRKLMPEELQQETIQEMTTTSQELQLLSTNILNWIKYQNENRRMAKETFNLNEMVGQVLGLLQSLAKQKNLVIENRVAAGMAIHQYYEPLKILIYNLLTNAIHFTEKGSIIVSAVRENDHIAVAVRDEGAGMTPEQIQRLMADDVVITSANVDNKKGHGLGYLIIKDLLKTMGATLHIESKKGEGTTVSIILQQK
ncbi:MAG: hypothetical protein JNK27_04685 [Chitinophagaceae bacterium]|nr:hypothetical protein [Chitinophagaceae bacterium]